MRKSSLTLIKQEDCAEPYYAGQRYMSRVAEIVSGESLTRRVSSMLANTMDVLRCCHVLMHFSKRLYNKSSLFNVQNM